ncbi:MAG: pyruvate dehydrogenase (acetyl-transferring) E1 component subunit alpha [Desulfobacteraceae bacterium]|nr:pyruvate dehydrogenase (acetyl-transferring) E1 component subunit alpha [Desulfobacteraceae bacterium]
MPRKTINFPDKIEYISILDENGRLDKSLEPDLPQDVLLRLYRYMVLGRRFDQRLLNLQRQGRIGTFPPISGQEAAHLGAVAPLTTDDWMVPAFRETAAELYRGRSLESVILGNAGFSEGSSIPEDQNMFPMSVPIATQLPHAVGLGWAIKYDKKDNIVMVFFGDGATSEGDFHEALNFAGVYQVPVVFVCQNNQWAISIPRSKQTRSQTLAQKALAYGITGVQVDGNDILAVYTAAKEAADHGRAGKGATLIECVTYRLMMHTTADDPKRYRKDEEVEQWKARDPIIRFGKYLKYKGFLDDGKMKSIETEVDREIQDAVDRAEAEMKKLTDPLHMFEHIYAELPPHIQIQRSEMARELTELQKEADHG